MGICTGQGAAPALRGGRTAHGLFYRVDTPYISGLYPQIPGSSYDIAATHATSPPTEDGPERPPE